MPTGGMGYYASWLRQYLGYCQEFKFSTVCFLTFSLFICCVDVVCFYLFSASVCSRITDEQEAFIRQVLDIPFDERRCKELITLDTQHAYYGGPEPMPTTRRLNAYSCQHKFLLLGFFLPFASYLCLLI